MTLDAYAECHNFKSIMLNFTILSVVMLNVLRLNAVAPLFLSVLVFVIEDKPS
jgi:hypothetical protein